jgi:hypothetical protein
MRWCLLPLMVLLFSCGADRRVMDTGLLQKRRHLQGWDLSLHRSKKVDRKALYRDDVSLDKLSVRSDHMTSSEKGLRASNTIIDEQPNEVSANASIEPGVVIQRNLTPVPFIIDLPDEPEDTTQKKPMNRLAPVVFITAIAAIGLGLTTTNTLGVIILVLVTFILAAISIRQIRSRDMGGKGFAIIGLVLAVMTAVATAIAIYANGGL